MKKHLIAAAVAAAVAAPAMAQNVSLYGAIDASVMNITKATSAGNISSAYVDGNLVSSVWGLRGSEDLGGGLRAVFETQGDLMTNNGGTHPTGLFRRAAWAGVAGPMGELSLGIRINPLIAANGTLVPVGGNAVMSNLSTVMGYGDFFTRNAITYTSPTFSGLSAQVQHGTSNTVEAGSAGSMTAWRLNYSAGGLTAVAAGQNRKSIAYSTGALSAANTPTPANTGIGAAETIYNAATGLMTGSVQTNRASLGKDTFLLGLRYSTGPWSVGAGRVTNEITNADGLTTSTGTNGLAVTASAGAKTKVSATVLGVGYQMSPALQLGASIMTAESSRNTNLQARYSLSKRTTAYAMYAVSDNDPNGVVKHVPVGSNTGTAPAAVAVVTGTANLKQTAVGAGLIHTF